MGYSLTMRIEKDSMGEVEVPSDALFGASTRRAMLNFPVSGHRMPLPFIHAVGLIKLASAVANESLGLLPPAKAELIKKAATEISEGKHDSQFPVDVFQTGSGTSTNMNVNEVIANRCSQLMEKPLGSKDPVHPNDDCNLGQSSNDTMPTALHLSLALELRDALRPALVSLRDDLEAKAHQFSDIVKIGRTHLMDATPLTLEQEFSGYVAQVSKSVIRVEKAIDALSELAIGGTAVGTGINTHDDFSRRVVAVLNAGTGLSLREAENHFEAQAARDDCVEVAGHLSTIAASLTKIANDLRWLGSGPRCGLGELQLPAVQPGSSIMPGKVNPVMSEMLNQVCHYAQGLGQTVVNCGRDGQFELNATVPLIAHSLHEAIRCLSRGIKVFAERCVREIEPNRTGIEAHVRESLMLVTALNPHIGYDNAARVAKQAFNEGKTLREVVLAEGLMDEAELDKALDPRSMIS
jgi:fumarate hydratase, class II